MVTKMGIDSSYIRGFFDAEGWVDAKRKSLGITNTNLSVLQDIEWFLSNKGIESSIVKRSRPAQNYRQCYVLRISGYHNILRFKQIIGSSFAEKKEKFEQLISSYKYEMFSHEDLSRIVNLRSMGLTFKRIAEKNG